jgi:hypothetical protein
MGYVARVSWDELKTEGVLRGLYVPKFIHCVSMKEAFKLLTELNQEQVQNIVIERIQNDV